MSDVPPEVVADIFTRLPVKTLLRFRSASKPFCALIDSPDFVKSHLDRTLESKSHRNVIISYCDIHSIDIDSLDKAILLNPPRTPNYGTQIFGHCNGLSGLLTGEDDVYLWNSSTREHKKLPATEIEFPDSVFPCVERMIYGFGYDHVNDDYKVVRVIQFFNVVESEIKVYSLKSNSWRRVKEDFPNFLRYKGAHGVFVNGILHWVVSPDSDLDDPTRLIASFDLATEKYQLVPQPAYLDTEFHLNVGELGGKLTAHCNYNMISIDIWVMNSYGVKESWTKLFSITQNVDISKFEYLKPIAYSKNGEKVLLLQEEGKLLWYDLKLKILKDIRIPNLPKFWEADVFMESLVKLPGGARTDITTDITPKKKRKNKKKKKTLQKRDDFLSEGFSLAL